MIVYPIAIATLMGFALSSGPEKPRVAFLNQVPENRDTIRIGDEKIDVTTYTDELFDRDREGRGAEPRSGALRRSARAKCWRRSSSRRTSRRSSRPAALVGASVEVIYNGDALKQSFVRSTISSKLAAADAALAKKVNQLAGTTSTSS